MIERKVSGQTYRDGLSLLSGQFLILATFMLNLITTFSAVWTIYKLNLGDKEAKWSFFAIDHETPIGDMFLFKRDITLNSLFISGRLEVSRLENDVLSIGGGSDQTGQMQTGLNLNSDCILMQAQHFGSNPSADSKYNFLLEREVNNLDVNGDIDNLRSIRSPISGLKEEVNMRIGSSDRLEFSGNSGLGIYAKRIELKSDVWISVESKESDIEIRSGLVNDGLHLPNLSVHISDIGTQPNDALMSNIKQAANFMSTDSAEEIYSICIKQSDGSLHYTTQVDCD